MYVYYESIATTLYARDALSRGVVRERDNLRIYSSVKCRQLDDAEYQISETLQPRQILSYTQLHALI